MMLKEVRKRVCDANIELEKKNLIIYTWGNVSEIDDETKLVVIKPSGVEYKNLTPENMVVVDLDGNVVEGDLRPSSDTMTHVEMYKKYKDIKGICHTHSKWATTFAQAKTPIDPYGTTHADYFYGSVKVTRDLTEEEIKEGYEKNTGKIINETLGDCNPLEVPAILCSSHGPFTWGKSAADAVYNAVVLEQIAEMNFNTLLLNGNINKLNSYILDKHYLRKHGKNAYYGQKKSK